MVVLCFFGLRFTVQARGVNLSLPHVSHFFVGERPPSTKPGPNQTHSASLLWKNFQQNMYIMLSLPGHQCEKLKPTPPVPPPPLKLYTINPVKLPQAQPGLAHASIITAPLLLRLLLLRFLLLLFLVWLLWRLPCVLLLLRGRGGVVHHGLCSVRCFRSVRRATAGV